MPKGRRRAWLFLGVGTAIFIAAAGAVVGGLAYAYRDKYYPGVQVAGIQLGGLSQQEGKRLIATRVRDYLEHPLRIVVPDLSKPTPDQEAAYGDLEIPTTAGHLGLAYASGAAADGAWQVGHSLNVIDWGRSVLPVLFASHSEPIDYKVNSKAIQDFINGEVVPKIGSPTPAKIAVKDAEVQIVPATPGFKVDQDKLREMVASSLSVAADKDTTYLRAPVSTVESSITAQSVQPLVDQLNHLGDLQLNLTATGGLSLKPSRTEILKWFSPVQDSKGVINLAVQSDAVGSYLSTQKVLDQAKSLTAVTTKLATLLSQPNPTGSVQLALVAKPVSATGSATAITGDYTPGRFPGKYVEVSLATQHMYLFNGTTLESVFPVSSGKASTPTPKGTYAIHGKAKMAFSHMYGLYMPWWENFLGGEYGIHELPVWPSGYREGEGHLGIPVSDGCIRLGIGPAQYVYNWTTDGTPVYIH